MHDYFKSALEILPYDFMGAAPLYSYIGDFIKCILHLSVPPIRDMKSLRVLLILSNSAFQNHNHTIRRNIFVGASRISDECLKHSYYTRVHFMFLVDFTFK